MGVSYPSGVFIMKNTFAGQTRQNMPLLTTYYKNLLS